MKLDHLAMYVKDLEAAKAFFVQYFGASSNEMYHNPKTGLRTYFLSFGDGSRLEIMSRPDVVDNGINHFQTGYIHLAFSVGGKKEVDELTNTLRADGFTVVSGPRVTGDGYYELTGEGGEFLSTLEKDLLAGTDERSLYEKMICLSQKNYCVLRRFMIEHPTAGDKEFRAVK